MALDQLCGDLIGEIERCIKHKDSPHERFAPYNAVTSIFRRRFHDLRERLFPTLFKINHRLHCEQLVQRTLGADKKGSGLCSILATLLYMRGGETVLNETVLKQFDKFFNGFYSGDFTSKYTDDDLPFTRSKCEDLFQDDRRAGDFYRQQFQFCPVVLKEHQNVIYKDHKRSCPLPYLKERYIDSGSYGTVYKVLIEPGHIRFSTRAGLDSGYDSPMWYARKEFELDLRDRRGENAFREEMEIIKEIQQQTKKHENIMVTQCSLEYGSRFNLFFELAESNLWEYLTDTKRVGPSTLKDKYEMFHRGVDLSGALAFLHNELTSTSFTRLSCYHLDLKPHNILVVIKNGQERWKITDFGMSRVKTVVKAEATELQRATTFLDIDLGKHFRRKPSVVNNPTAHASTENRRGEGTYLAPETVVDGRVGAESDIWSFGCVFSLVITYIDSGPSGVLDFDKFRGEPAGSVGNHFYEFNKDLDTYQINRQVIKWFKKLCNDASERDPIEERIFKSTTELLTTRLLVATREGRRKIKAEDVQKQLREIASMFPGVAPRAARSITQGSNAVESSKPLASKEPKPSFAARARRFTSWLSTEKKNQVGILARELDVSGADSKAMFSQNGDLLAFFSPRLIKLFPMSNIRAASTKEKLQAFQCFKPPDNREWGGVCLNSAYLCAYTKADYFEWRITTDTSPDPPIIKRRKIEAVQRLAISQDSQFLACAMKARNRTDFELHLFRRQELDDLVGGEPLSPVSTQGEFPQPSRRSNSTSTFMSDHTPPWRNILKDGNLGAIRGVRGLNFSPDGSYLTLVTEPTPSPGPAGNVALKKNTVMCWTTSDGKRLQPFDVNNDGLGDIRSSVLTAYASFNMRPETLVISGQNTIRHHFDNHEKTSRQLKPRLYDAVLTEDDERVILLGDNGRQDLKKIYSLPTADIDNVEDVSKHCEIGLTPYEAKTDSMCLSTHNGTKQVLVATRTGNLRIIPAPWI